MAERSWGRHAVLATSAGIALVTLLLGRAAFAGVPRGPGVSFSVSPQTMRSRGAPTSALNNAAILIDALLYDGYEYLDADEAVALYNSGTVTVSLDGWCLSDGSSQACVPAGYSLAPETVLWLARNATAFERQFGFAPQIVLSPWPGFANAGDEVLLLRPDGYAADVLVYKQGNVSVSGWQGPALEPYRVAGVFAEEGQILYRRRDPESGHPVTDTDSALDWAQTPDDVLTGRRVRYPGWSLETFFLPATLTATGTITIAVAPDNAYEVFRNQIASARSSLYLSSLTFRSIALAHDLAAAAARGVNVVILLEGGPAGGIEDQERYACQTVEAAGGACWFMIQDVDNDIYDRYRFLHAKYVIVDGERAVIGSENLSPDSMPDDDKSDGTYGRRGIFIVTDAAAVVARLQAIWADDFAPLAHRDLLRWSASDPIYGAPPDTFVPITVTGGVGYDPRYPQAIALSGTFPMRVNQSPENSLNPGSGTNSLLSLLGHAGEGDTILVQQLEERPHWGAAGSDPVVDPNPRLEAYIAAARRGARVRLLLDAYFDDEGSATSNAMTCSSVNQLAAMETLNLTCQRNNPTGLGLHNKMVLVELDGKGWVHVGSLNGSELSHKGNREVALLLQSNDAYGFLADMFEHDWSHLVHIPALHRAYIGPPPHLLISEFLYDPAGGDDAEFIELVNPGYFPVDISQWMLGDATSVTDFEDMRRFPPGAALPPSATLVVALSGTGFYAAFGFWPDFEVIDSHPAVPNLIDDPNWGDPGAVLQLGNSGDEILLRRSDGTLVDAVAYGSGVVPGVAPCPLVARSGNSFERFPYWRDVDDCAADFRDWPLPNPGYLP